MFSRLFLESTMYHNSLYVSIQNFNIIHARHNINIYPIRYNHSECDKNIMEITQKCGMKRSNLRKNVTNEKKEGFRIYFF